MVQSRTKTRIITHAVIRGMVAGGVLSTALVAPNTLQLVDLYLKKLDKKAAQKTLAYLKYRKLVDVQLINGNYHYKLTQRGRDKYQKIVLDELRIKVPRIWDQKWRIVMFDIPDGHRNQRDGLLGKLKTWDFYMLQKSVWIHPFECEKQVGVLLNTLCLEKYASYLTVEDGNFTTHVEEYFKKRGLLV